jgi:hypothetical protein
LDTVGATVIPSHSGGFREFKVYDKARASPDWTSVVSPAQCAVFFKDFETAAPVSHDGAPISRMTDCTVLVFDRLDEARRFCETRVAQHRSLCCEIFDCEGKAKPPLLTVVHPSMVEKDELSATWWRRRRVMAIVCFLAAVPLFVWDSRADWYLILPSLIAFNLIFLGLRLLYWNTARKSRDREQARHFEEHLRREKYSISGTEDPLMRTPGDDAHP